MLPIYFYYAIIVFFSALYSICTNKTFNRFKTIKYCLQKKLKLFPVWCTDKKPQYRKEHYF